MKLLLIFIITAFLILTDHTHGAAFFWCAAIAAFHAIEETQGKLWSYFGRLTGAYWLRESGYGFWVIVLPALLLQVFAAWQAFMGANICPFWLALLIGTRVGDAVFSHAIPYARDRLENPGLPTACLYAADAVLLALVWHVPMMQAEPDAILGFLIGAGFFASVQPGLKITSNLF